MVDISDPTQPTEMGYYDTYLPEEGRFNGAWSVYPFFASGKLIVSDMQTGLFVLEYEGAPIIPPELPESVTFNPNYPNPFNPSTLLSFSIPATSRVDLSVYDMLGRRVATLLSEATYNAGTHTVPFSVVEGTSGVYMARLKISSDQGTTTLTRKMMLLR